MLLRVSEEPEAYRKEVDPPTSSLAKANLTASF
jgi:hypothetical protein